MIKINEHPAHPEAEEKRTNRVHEEKSWEGKRTKQMKTGILDSGLAIKGVALDAPSHLADALKQGALTVYSLANATRNAVSGVYNMATAPLGAVYDIGTQLRNGYRRNVGDHTVRGLHRRDIHEGKGDDLVLSN